METIITERQYLPSAPGASWIWPSECRDAPNQYVWFQQDFFLEKEAGNAELLISADTTFAIWFNGELVDCQQFADYPASKTFYRLNVESWLKSGTNQLKILVYHQGRSTATYIKGMACLIYCLLADGKEAARSGKATYYRKSTGYKNGMMPMFSGQMSFTFEYDAREEDSARDQAWKQIDGRDIYTSGDKPLDDRSIKKVEIKKRIEVSVHAQGVFRRDLNEEGSVAEVMQRDFLSSALPLDIMLNADENEFPQKQLYPLTKCLPDEKGVSLNPDAFKKGDGIYLVLDLGREEVGLFELEAYAEVGMVIDIAYGEHLSDLRVRSDLPGRNFASRYICRTGRQKFTYCFARWAGRYIQLHISGDPEKFQLYYAGLREVMFPVEEKGDFVCHDKLLNKIYDTSVRTLHLCMHEHYEDCPWREQALYANDSRNQALCGYYCFGDYEFPAMSWDLLGKGLKEDGYLEVCAPAIHDVTIPSFSLLWIAALADHLLFSGDTNFAKRMLLTVNRKMDILLKNMEDYLLPTPQGKRYWQFYEWTPELAGLRGENSNKEREALDCLRYDAPLNMFFLVALDSAVFLNTHCDNKEKAEEYKKIANEMRVAVHDQFWDKNEGSYINYKGKDTSDSFSELTQALAVYSGVCPDNLTQELNARLASEENGFIPVSLSQSFYKFEALLQEKDKYGGWVFEKIAEDWGYMLFQGATSFWETINGSSELSGAGSLCHGWSAIPAYFFHAYLLGVRPLSPGFKDFTVDPLQGVVKEASGSIPSPYGEIAINTTFNEENIQSQMKRPSNTLPQASGNINIINTIREE